MARAERPVLFLDIDGTLSPLAGRDMAPLPETWPEWRQLDRRFRMWVAPQCVAGLEALPVDRVWCSTWRGMVEGPRGLNAQLGWHKTPWLAVAHGAASSAKQSAIAEWLHRYGARPFIWADDEMTTGNRRWVRSLSVATLVIKPETTVGLTATHLARMNRWVQESCVGSR